MLLEGVTLTTTYEELAAAILLQQATPETVKGLAACLQHKNGAVRIGDTGRGLAVLGDIHNMMKVGTPKFMPTITSVRLPLTPAKRFVGDTRFAGRIWRDMSKRGLGRQRPENAEWYGWAPSATRSLARLTIGGPIGGVVHTTPDLKDPHNTYNWYDLDVVPVGGVVYRITSDSHVIAVQRLVAGKSSLWVQLNGGNALRDWGNSYDLVQRYKADLPAPDTSCALPLTYDVPTLRKQLAAK